jgi:Protein of unknown function (DUF3096)
VTAFAGGRRSRLGNGRIITLGLGHRYFSWYFVCPGRFSKGHSDRACHGSSAYWHDGFGTRTDQGRSSNDTDHYDWPNHSAVAGILILLVPRILNYVVAVYLILIGLIGLFGV